ncbi:MULTISPECIES: ATP-dependent nuclease [unclassified Acidovorax]|uniref:ATP-dependent nuclease n=1 Tax=unclassified Acidovorax TaxID=2684926 RepID=UPI0009E99E2D|nr:MULTISPECIES: ATP-binding protein [unclassified Acidovorax]
MKLEEISILNFCSCENVTIPLGSFTPIIGYNNAGKSTILRAISWLLRKSVLSPAKFTNLANAVVVSGVIDNPQVGALPPNQQAQVSKYLHNNKLTIRRIQEAPNVRAAEIKLEVLDPASGDWLPNPTGIDNALAALFPEPIFIEAMDNASEDVNQFAAKNTIGLLLKNTMEQIRTNNVAALATLTSALSNAAAHLNGPNRIAEFALFESAATTALAKFFPGLSIHLSMQSPTLEDVVKTASIALSDTNNPAPIGFSSYGHGTQRTVQMALINLLASQLRPATPGQTTTLLLIDEPELYLHPHAIELLRDSLIAISQNDFQIVFTTHSPLVIGEKILDTLVAYKNPNGRTEVRKKLSTAANNLQNMAHHTAVVFSLQNSSYFLFSESIVIVEGKTEKMVIPEMYRAVRGAQLARNKTCVIEVSGSGSIEPTRSVLSEVGFNSKAIVDLDYVFKQAPKFLPTLTTNLDFIACKNWFNANAALLNFSLGTDGYPCKGGSLLPEAAFMAMANAMPQEVQNLAAQLNASGYWVWSLGAIESHLGIGKNDTDRLAFLTLTKASGNLNHAADPNGLNNCMSWI